MDANGIFSDLLTVEVNTIVKANMTGQKMPSLPFALLDIIEEFALALIELGVDLEPYLVPTSAQCWDQIRQHPHKLEQAKQAYETANDGAQAPEDLTLYDYVCDLWPALDPSVTTWPQTPGWRFSMETVSNGWDSFERLRIAALLAAPTLTAGHQTLIDRIVGACSRLKYIVQGVQQRHHHRRDGASSRSGLRERLGLGSGLDAGTIGDDAGQRFSSLQELIPKTRNELLRRGQRDKSVPIHRLSAEDQGVIRKIWEIGTETVLAQTCVQIDGDVITRISEDLIKEHTAAIQQLVLSCHHQSIDIGLSHWRSLVQVAIVLVKNVFGQISSR